MAKAPTANQLAVLIAHYESRVDEVDLFKKQVSDFFQSKRFSSGNTPLVHSLKSRLKDPSHLEDKIRRKWADGKILPADLFSRITDLAGVRVLHLYTKQFEKIHQHIGRHIADGFWVLHEEPIAYSWDPEATQYFEALGLKAETRESYYTSIHYVVRPHANAAVTCEIQVRTLFEEAWGEIDHALNYPQKTKNAACREQLRVLAKLTSTGTRLADAIFNISDPDFR